MKHLVPLLFLLASCSTTTTRIMAVGGKNDLGSNLSPAEEQVSGGLEISSGPRRGGLGFELGARYGQDNGTASGIGVTTESYEYYAGGRYEWRLGDWSPYLAAGLTELRLRSREESSSSGHDSDLGYYAALGADYHFGAGWHFGASLRKTVDHDIKFLGSETEADAWQYLMRLGYAF